MASSIISIQNQPLKLSAAADDSCNCEQPTQCVLYVPEQQVYSQLQILPCGEVSVCNNTLGDELILNGNFATNLDDWTPGAGWAWAGGAACNDGSPNSIAQTVAGLTTGKAYVLSFEIAAYTGSSLDVFLGGTALAGNSFTADGIYTEVVIAGAGTDILFVSQTEFEGCIDNVSLKEIVSCWDADETDWYTSASGACHNKGNTTPLINIGTVIELGGYYHMTFTVTGALTGGVQMFFGLDPIGAVTSGNGTFDRWGISNGTDISFVPTTDFDGCISALTVVPYCNDYLFHLLDADRNFIFDLTGYFTLFEDRYNLEDFHWDDIGIPYGCYMLCMIDCCYGDLHQFDANLILNGDFAAGDDDWTFLDANFFGGQVTIDANGYIEQALSTTREVDCIRIRFNWTNEGGSGNINILMNGESIDSEILGAGSGSADFTTNTVPAGAVIRILAMPNLANVSIDNVVITVPEQCRVYDQCSPCIKYAEEFDCTKMVEGYCEGNALGFSFDDSAGSNWFKISQRLKCELFNSTYNQEQSDYTFSTGVSSLNYASSEKIKTLFIQPIPEYKHDALALVKVCDHIFVDTIEYFSPKGDYTPEWNRNVLTDLAQSKMELRVKDQTLFNTNCE